MPLNLGRGNAIKKGYKQKNGLKQYLGAETFWVSRKTERGNCSKQSREIEQKEKIGHINEKRNEKESVAALERRHSRIQRTIERRQEVKEDTDFKKEGEINGEETKTRNRRKIQSDREIGSEVGSEKPRSRRSRSRHEEVRSQEDGISSQEGPEEIITSS